MSIKQNLSKLGLNEKEILLYLTLLKHGRTKPGILAILTKLNRATIYSTANSLMSLGIIAEDLSGKTLAFTPLPIENLGKIISESKRDLKEKEVLVQETINDLKIIRLEKTLPIPKIRFIEEHDLEKFLFDNLEKWQQDVINSDGIWWGFQDPSFVENYRKWIDHSWKTDLSKNKNYRAKFFTNQSIIENKLKKLVSANKRAINFIENIKFTGSLWISGDYLVMVVTSQRPFYLVEFHDKTLAHNLREMLKQLWIKNGF